MYKRQEEAHKSFYLYDFKKGQWDQQNIPTYIVTHYKIDVTSDEIESHISLFALKEDAKQLKEIMKNFIQ